MSVVKTSSGIKVTFTVKNNSTTEVMKGVNLVMDAFPTGVTYASNAVSVGTYTVGTRTWAIGDMAANATQTIDLVFTLDDASALPLDIVANLTTTSTEVNTANNKATRTITHDVLTAFELVKEISAAYTVQPGVDNFISIDGAGGAVTLTLPPSAAFAKPDGGYYSVTVWVRDDNTGASTITIDGDAGDTIYDGDGAGTAANTGITLVESANSRVITFDTDTPTNILLF